MNKKEIRALVRQKKRALTPEQIRLASEALGEKLRRSELYQKARTIYGYLPYNQEVLTVPMLRRAMEDGKRVAEMKDAGVYRVTVSVSDDPNVTAESFTFTVTVNRATYSVDGKITVVGDTTYIAGKAGEINLRVALTGADGVTVREHHFTGDRARIRHAAASNALDMLRRALI